MTRRTARATHSSTVWYNIEAEIIILHLGLCRNAGRANRITVVMCVARAVRLVTRLGGRHLTSEGDSLLRSNIPPGDTLREAGWHSSLDINVLSRASVSFIAVAKTSMNCFCLILSALSLCLSLQVGGASVINRHVPYPFLPGVVARSPLVRRDTERRQTDVGSCSSEEFEKKLISVECQQSFAQPALDIHAECGFNELGELAVDVCRTSNGKTCAELTVGSANDLTFLFTDCLGSDSCSSECNATVQNTIDRLGCCFTTLVDVISTTLGVDVSTTFDLAFLCGIALPSPCETSSSLTFTPSEVTTQCSNDELLDRFTTEVSCNPQIQKMIIEIFQSCNYELGIDSLAATCRVNEKGVFCIRLLNVTANLLNIAADSDIVNDCAPSNDTCSSSCRDAIQAYRNDYGCCINTLFNFTTIPPPSASYELWSLCDVDTVGQCKSTLDPLIDSAMTLAITKVMIIFALLTLLV